MIYSEDDHDLLMDRAYEDNKTRALAEEHGFNVVVPPKKNRKDPWEYVKTLGNMIKNFTKSEIK